MPISNGYVTLAEIKTAIGGVTGSDKDGDLERAVESASRAIDEFCRRRFWQDPSVVARYYTADPDAYTVVTDDISTATGLIVATDPGDDGTFEITWTKDTDFRLLPINADADSEPWTQLERIRTGSYTFPDHKHRVKVTAKFGWATTPTAIKQACLTQAIRFYQRRNSPFGVAGSTEFGAVRLLNKLDPDVEMGIKPYRRIRVPGQKIAVA